MNLYDREVLIDIGKDGSLTFRQRGTAAPQKPIMLPVFSVDSVSDAEVLIATVARRQYDGRYVLNDWQVPDDDEAIEAMNAASRKLDAAYEHMRSRTR